MDVTCENFGTLDNLITVSRDNSLSLSDVLGSTIEINNTNLGVKDVKQNIIDNDYNFNNDHALLLEGWILATGFWNDNGEWIDTETWID